MRRKAPLIVQRSLLLGIVALPLTVIACLTSRLRSLRCPRQCRPHSRRRRRLLHSPRQRRRLSSPHQRRRLRSPLQSPHRPRRHSPHQCRPHSRHLRRHRACVAGRVAAAETALKVDGADRARMRARVAAGIGAMAVRRRARGVGCGPSGPVEHHWRRSELADEYRALSVPLQSAGPGVCSEQMMVKT